MAYRKPISPPEQTCTSVVDCAVSNPDPMALVVLLATAGVLLLFAALALAHIDAARSLLEEERTRIADEAAAFATFARRVADVEAATTTVTDGGPTASRTLETAPGDDRLTPVREAYRETVMAVPHYDEEYGESLARNMSLEFGEDVASAVESGGALTPQLKATLVERSRTARRQRASLLAQLEAEREALSKGESTLRSCRRTADRIADADLSRSSFDELRSEWRLLEDRREDAEALLAERQETIQDRERSATARPGGPSFEQYLYDPMSVTHPVLAAGTTVVDRLDGARERVEKALASAT
jgi:hypothetical protein